MMTRQELKNIVQTASSELLRCQGVLNSHDRERVEVQSKLEEMSEHRKKLIESLRRLKKARVSSLSEYRAIQKELTKLENEIRDAQIIISRRTDAINSYGETIEEIRQAISRANKELATYGHIISLYK